jgi:hypothetical protein
MEQREEGISGSGSRVGCCDRWLAGWLLGGGARGVGIGRVRDRQVDSNARVSSR